MSATPGHQELQEMLPAAALEMLEPGELAKVMTHVRSCPECARLLRQYRDAGAAISLGLPPRQLDTARAGALRTRLLDRARGDRAVLQFRRPASVVHQWTGWMVAAGLAGLLLVHHSVHRELDYGWLAAGVLALLALGLGVYLGVQSRRLKALRDQVTGRFETRVGQNRTSDRE